MRVLVKISVLAAAALSLGGCFALHGTGSSADAYVGRSVAEYAAVHGSPAQTIKLSNHQSLFRWDTIEDAVGPAIDQGLTGETQRRPMPTLCSVRLTATTQSPNPELKDWTIQSADSDGGC
jgi:hypothetical protein